MPSPTKKTSNGSSSNSKTPLLYDDLFINRILPLMLESCKMKNEDYEKFKKDKTNADVLEKKKEISRMTIRSMAAKTIEKISGTNKHR
jgi:hypothetical protein